MDAVEGLAAGCGRGGGGGSPEQEGPEFEERGRVRPGRGGVLVHGAATRSAVEVVWYSVANERARAVAGNRCHAKPKIARDFYLSRQFKPIFDVCVAMTSCDPLGVYTEVEYGVVP